LAFARIYGGRSYSCAGTNPEAPEWPMLIRDANKALKKHGPAATKTSRERAAHISALNSGKAGSEVDKAAGAEIDFTVAGYQESSGAPMNEDLDAALLEAFGEALPSREADRRGKAERRMTVRPDDGRCKCATGRTVQFNIVMKPNFKAAVSKAAHKTGVPVTVWIKMAALAYIGSGANMHMLIPIGCIAIQRQACRFLRLMSANTVLYGGIRAASLCAVAIA
jgi:hypothetical protein